MRVTRVKIKNKKKSNNEEAELKKLLKNKNQNKITLKYVKDNIRKIESVKKKVRKKEEIDLRFGGRVDNFDWGHQDALIRYYYHCDPLDLTLPQYLGLMENLAEIWEMEHGGAGEKNTEAELEKMLKKKKENIQLYP